MSLYVVVATKSSNTMFLGNGVLHNYRTNATTYSSPSAATQAARKASNNFPTWTFAVKPLADVKGAA